jgi:D-sedoheptulose 7-phosphate isomerase
MNLAQEYVRDLQATLDSLPIDKIEQTISILIQARIDNRQVFIMGNGGSAATASHFVCDLAKNTRQVGQNHFKVIGLSDNISLISALANDEGYENIFVQQMINFLNPGDIVIAISASGNSPNVVKAVAYACEMKAITIGFTGFDGGKLGQMVDLNVHIKSDCIEHVEDIHLVLEHMIIKSIKANGHQTSQKVETDVVQMADDQLSRY